jgi:hypothetical protein
MKTVERTFLANLYSLAFFNLASFAFASLSAFGPEGSSSSLSSSSICDLKIAVVVD